MFAKDWLDSGVRFFKSPRPLQVCFSIEDLQGDGFIRLTFGLLYRSIQFTTQFNGNPDGWIKYRCDWRLFNSRV
jgi:hypothetical protein